MCDLPISCNTRFQVRCVRSRRYSYLCSWRTESATLLPLSDSAVTKPRDAEGGRTPTSLFLYDKHQDRKDDAFLAKTKQGTGRFVSYQKGITQFHSRNPEPKGEERSHVLDNTAFTVRERQFVNKSKHTLCSQIDSDCVVLCEQSDTLSVKASVPGLLN